MQDVLLYEILIFYTYIEHRQTYSFVCCNKYRDTTQRITAIYRKNIASDKILLIISKLYRLPLYLIFYFMSMFS